MILNLCSRFRHKLFDNPLLFYCVFCRNANIALQTGTASVGPQVQGRNQTNNETLSNGNNKRAHETVDIMEIEKQDFPAGLTTYLNIYLTKQNLRKISPRKDKKHAHFSCLYHRAFARKQQELFFEPQNEQTLF